MDYCEHTTWHRRWNKHNRLRYDWHGLKYRKYKPDSCDEDWFIEHYGDDGKITCKECNKSFCTGHFNPNTHKEEENICYRCEGKWGWCYACLKPDPSPDKSIRRAAANTIRRWSSYPYHDEEYERAELGLPSFETKLSKTIAENFPDKTRNRGFQWSIRLCKECGKHQDQVMNEWEREIDR